MKSLRSFFTQGIISLVCSLLFYVHAHLLVISLTGSHCFKTKETPFWFRTKRGRGAVGPRMDETGPYLPHSDREPSTSPNVRERCVIYGPEKPLSLRSYESSEEAELHEERRKKSKRSHSRSSDKEHSKKRRSKDKSKHKKKKKREERRSKHHH